LNIWLQIASAAMVLLMLYFLYPAARHWLKNGPKAQSGDWSAAIVPLMLVVGFVALLIMLVR
jgi:hypothetical protein